MAMGIDKETSNLFSHKPSSLRSTISPQHHLFAILAPISLPITSNLLSNVTAERNSERNRNHQHIKVIQ